MAQSPSNIFPLAAGLVKKCLEDEIDQSNCKELCRSLNCNSKDRKKIFSLLVKYFEHQANLREIRKQYKINPKKAGLSKTLVDLIITDRLYSHFDNSKLFAHLSEGKFIKQFDKYLNEAKKSIELKPLQEKQERKPKVKTEQKKSKKREEGDPFAGEKYVPIKYLRINKIKTDVDTLCRELINKHELIQVGGKFDSFSAFLKKLFALQENEFMLDYHFPDDLIVVHKSQSGFFQQLKEYENGEMIFQDKACLLVLKCVQLKAGMKIGDICCAPGMKTAAIASFLKNECDLISVDKDEQRMEVMNELMEKLGVKCSKYITADFTQLTEEDFEIPLPRMGDKRLKTEKREFDVIFLDPSCSGSGILKRGDEPNDDRQRQMKLASFQTKLISHAMRLRPKWLIYSTCSYSVWENEFVVSKSLEQAENAHEFELVEALSQWPQRGDPKFKCHPYVIRTGPNRGTQGFFAAVFRRVN